MPLPIPISADFEKLGAFYLGREYDIDAAKRRDALLLYDSRDLVTHAVCVGMTGSGKTGLCLTLLEEAAIDGIPAIIIDPKGDLSNLLLAFPDLRPEDFRPWINEDDAERKGLTPDAFATEQAARWAAGLAEWGQNGARIARFKQAADFTIFTPGSNAGSPVSVLKSFDPPGESIVEDHEAFRERVSGTATSLLGLIGIAADPVTSREHILLSTILGDAWARSEALDLAAIIQRIQSPPPSVQRIGVMDLETFYPSKDRFALAVALNNLVAAPGFSRWLEGEPLDIGAMLRTPQGKPRLSIFSIAHLSDPERMFFVSLLLNQILSWVRTQSGTTSLRALLYMDEIAGYFPPTANPPSKPPLLTLMKQGRAFGFGVVLATQNPVDLDYKGLANAGTWFIGRLQTERDKARVLDGLEGAAANAPGGFDRAAADKLMSRLGTRIFLMNNIHDNGPVVFETRWALSYLRGPLTRQQIKLLSQPSLTPQSLQPQTTPAKSAAKSVAAPLPASTRPVLPPDIPEFFIPLRGVAPNSPITYRAMLLGCGTVYFTDTKAGIDTESRPSLLAPIASGPVPIDWLTAEAVEVADTDLESAPSSGATFSDLPPEAGKPKSFAAWKKTFSDALFRLQTLDLLRCPDTHETSRPGESERDFRARLALAAHEARDAAAEKLRAKYAPRLAALEDRARRAAQAIEVQKEQSRSAKVSTALSFGTTILGAVFGRKILSASNASRAATAARGVGRSAKESSDVGRAEENFEALQQQHADLAIQFKAELDELSATHDSAAETLEKVSLRPKKTNITVRTVVLVWAPQDADGNDLWR